MWWRSFKHVKKEQKEAMTYRVCDFLVINTLSGQYSTELYMMLHESHLCALW